VDPEQGRGLSAIAGGIGADYITVEQLQSRASGTLDSEVGPAGKLKNAEREKLDKKRALLPLC